MAEITKEQLAQIKAECEPHVNTATRQVPGGYIVTGQVQWSKDGVVQAVQQDECVCGIEQIGTLVGRYHRCHNFNVDDAAYPGGGQ